jgi:hypothetical protein
MFHPMPHVTILCYVPNYPSDWLLTRSSGVEHQLSGKEQILIKFSEKVQDNTEIKLSSRSGVYITSSLFYGALIIPSCKVA